MADNGTVDSTEALGALAGDLLGDFSFTDVPDPDGAPLDAPASAESPITPEAPADPVEGDVVPVEPSPTPATDAPDTPPDDTPVDPETAFAAEPAMTYRVDGQEKAYDGIRVVDGAGYIPPSKLPDVQRKLGERDHLFEANQKLFAKTREYDSALVYRTGAEGKQQEYRGVHAFRQVLADAESNGAAGKFLLEQFAAVFPNPSPEQKQALKDIFDRAQLIMENATLRTAQRFGTDMQSRMAESAVSPAPTLDQRFEETFQQVSTWAKAGNHLLTDKDYKDARRIYGGVKGALTRQATAADTQYGVKVGTTIYDPTPLNEFFTDRAAENAEKKRTDAAGSQIDRTNAHRLATAVRPKAVPAAPRRQDQPVRDQRAADGDAAWDLKERLASARM